MNNNLDNIDDFDKYVKNQIETISYDFDEKDWEQLHSKLNQLDAKNTTFLSDINYKSLFVITAILLVATLATSIFYYLQTDKTTKDVLQPIIESTTNTTLPVETEVSSLDSIQRDSLVTMEEYTKPKKYEAEQVVIKPETNSKLKDEVIPQESQKENQKMELDSLPANKKSKKYIVW